MSEFKGTKGKFSVSDYGHCLVVEVKTESGSEHTVVTDKFCHACGDKASNMDLIAHALNLAQKHPDIENWERLIELGKAVEAACPEVNPESNS